MAPCKWRYGSYVMAITQLAYLIIGTIFKISTLSGFINIGVTAGSSCFKGYNTFSGRTFYDFVFPSYIHGGTFLNFKNRQGPDICRAPARASSVVIVTFSLPRSMRPTYARSTSAASASRSCDRPRSTRSRRRFQPIVCRARMTAPEGLICGLTIDGLAIPYSTHQARSGPANPPSPVSPSFRPGLNHQGGNP